MIQTCLICKKEYVADSHEYPCPYCTINKKMKALDKAYMRLYGSIGEGASGPMVSAIHDTMKICDDALENKYMSGNSEDCC